MPVNRVEDVIPWPELLEELTYLANLPQPWLKIVPAEPPTFQVHINCVLPPLVARLHYGGQALRSAERQSVGNLGANELCGLLAQSMWLKDGPRVIRPTPEQAESLSHVEINLELGDYEQPFHTVLVETPNNPVFTSITLCRISPDVLILDLHSKGSTDDIVTLIRHEPGRLVEDSLKLVEDDCKSLLPHSIACQRVALNMCLALVNYGNKTEPLLPKQLKEDEGWAKEDTERGARARRRVKRHLHKVSFVHDVIVRQTCDKGDGEPTGKTVAPHWVRGHWKSQPYGKGMSQRKRILVRPYLVHAEAYVKDSSLTVYRDHR